MNKTVLIFPAALLLLTGCAQTYVMTLSDGLHISSKGKPHLVQGYWVYTDMSGHKAAEKAILVREVAPASMVTDETSGFRPVHSN